MILICLVPIEIHPEIVNHMISDEFFQRFEDFYLGGNLIKTYTETTEKISLEEVNSNTKKSLK